MTAVKRWLGVVVLAGPLGCSAQAEPDYRGEPLVVVRGAIVTGEQTPPSDVEAAVVWVSEPDRDGWPIARARVRGEFPAQFTIEVFDPPPPPSVWGVERQDEELDPSSIGILAAIAPDSGDRVSYDEILGVWLDGGVQYFQRDANGEAGDWVLRESERRKVPPTRGYHLYRQTLDEEAERESFRCQNRDLCVHYVSTSAPGQDLPGRAGTARYAADARVFQDAEYARCLQYLEEPATCTVYLPEPRTEQEQAETSRCADLQDQSQQRALAATDNPVSCSSGWQYRENAEGFDHPVTIELGTSWLQWMNPRYRE